MVDIDTQSVKILVVKSNKKPEIRKIPKNLSGFREVIGNENIEVENYKRAIIVYDAQGLAKNLPISRYIETEFGKKAVRGNFFIVGNDNYYGDYKDLTEEEIQSFMNEFDLEKEEEMEM